jgi:serine/threonine-protein kinase
VSRFNSGDIVSGKYRIVRLIGDGGMGVVYEARHEVLGSGVALKFLHSDLAKRPGLTQRFMQEARVSATIQSPHVTHVTDVDTAQDGSPYLVMELLAGQSLQSMLDRQGKLSPDQAIDFALQILAGLEAAHAIGVVHRDMKPDNVFVTPSGGGPLLKLIDFGIAKLRASSEYSKGLTRAGVVMGTPEYMAPEQLLSAHTTDHRADIYSLGVMLFEMLTGLRPADGEDADVIVAAVEAGRVRNLRELLPGAPEGLVQVVERATAPARDSRFASASDMRLELARYAGQLSHAGRLAAVAEPLPVLPTPAASAVVSLPPPPSAAQPAAVPKTVPPDGPPLSVSQLGAARTSISANEPPLSQMPRAMFPGTELGAPALGGSPPITAQYSASAARPRRRSGLLVFTLVAAVLGGGGAVGYAAYRAADNERDPIPPLPDAAVPSGTLAIAPLNPEVKPDAPSTPSTGAATAPRPGTTRPPATPGVGGAPANPGPVTGTAGAPTFQLPFPLPSAIQIPTAFPSAIQLPPGFPTTFPPLLPGAQPAPGSTPPGTTPPATTPPATTPPATPAPTGASPPKKTTTRPLSP